MTYFVLAAITAAISLIALADPWTYELRERVMRRLRDELDRHGEAISEALRDLRDSQEWNGKGL